MWRFRNLRARGNDFVTMGRAIEQRAERCGVLWESHLQTIRAFEQEVLDRFPRDVRIAVVGAGRLLDVPIEALSRPGLAVTLIDVDQSVLPCWQKFRDASAGSVKFRFEECTNALDRWTVECEEFFKGEARRTVGEFAQCLAQLERPEPISLGAHFDLVLSQNLLGQLGLYWRDRVIALGCRHLRLSEDQLYGLLAEVLLELQGVLEESHLRSLVESGAREIVVVSDINFIWYSPDGKSWQESAATKVGLPPELVGYSMVSEKKWWWDLAPAELEGTPLGEAHEMGAWHYCRL